MSQIIKTAFAKALAEAKSDPEKVADILETLLSSATIAISIQARGNTELMGELLEGSSAYLFSRAGDFQKMGEFIAKAVE